MNQLCDGFSSHLFIEKCNHKKKRYISDFLDIPVTDPPTTYLGAPLFFGSSKSFHFENLVDAFRSKLAGWKANVLSFAGRLILVKHVLAIIPLNIFLSTPCPKKVCLHIEWILRNFLWSTNYSKSKHNIVLWEIVCLPKSEGGLGIRCINDVNDSCMLKLGWIGKTPSSLSENWIKARYLKSNSIWDHNNPFIDIQKCSL